MDFIAGILELLGLYLVGNKWRLAFLFNFLGGCSWIFYVIYTGEAKGLLIVVIPALVINVRNYWKWR